ncbi:hypothetical protein HPP92_004193 [Vanilla planifolia]|uniref:Polygalacturonase QRT3 n=1 Tax=Vanilla planifolia TaxID=51239 RepID=A0A835S9R0_VANPL|nr:hypothetical protein HPP92_004193 [Vanilla planifolia]
MGPSNLLTAFLIFSLLALSSTHENGGFALGDADAQEDLENRAYIDDQEDYEEYRSRPSDAGLFYRRRLQRVQQRHRKLLGDSPQSAGSLSGARIFNVINYGADPSGVLDSADAITQAVNAAFSEQKGSELLPGINNLGGVVLDLAGGIYNISSPIRFPPGGGNVLVQRGTLRASPGFPGDGYIIELVSPESKRLDRMAMADSNKAAAPKNVGIYYEDITFRDVVFDGSFIGGGLLVVDSARTRIDDCFFIHFGTDGMLVEGGHETYVASTFVGQYLTIGGDPRERNFSGIGIDLASNDNALTDVVIFSAGKGVVLRGQANMITGVHCYNKATGFGGVGIDVKLPGNSATRIDNSYLDYTGIVLEDPTQVHVTNCFFLGDGNILLKSIKGEISGLTIVNNMFVGSHTNVPIVTLDQSNVPFTSVDQVVIDQNNVNGMMLKSTVGKKTVSGNGTKWSADFSNLLVFPRHIKHLQYSFLVRGRTFPKHAVTEVKDNVVVVEADKPVDAIVTVSVDQNLMQGEKSDYY